MASYKSHKINDYFETAEENAREYWGEWQWVHSVKNKLPCAPGVFKFGCKMHGDIEVMYIGHTTQHRTLREVIFSMLHGFEGGERLEMFLIDPCIRNEVMIQTMPSIYPEELIEDELEEYLATHHKVPEYNDPMEDDKGIWVVVDQEGHPSNTCSGNY